MVRGSTIYAGGEFSLIGGQQRNAIAALSTITGKATAWNPNAQSFPGIPIVRTLATNSTTIYAGGWFEKIGGQAHTGLAALDPITGKATSWSPGAQNEVYTLVLQGSTLYVGGSFSAIGGQPRNNLAALDTNSGKATSWNPNPNSSIYTMALSGTTMFVGGLFDIVAGQRRTNLAALDVGTAQPIAWAPETNFFLYGPEVFALAVRGTTLYAGGSFGGIDNLSQSGIAAISATKSASTTGATGVTTTTARLTGTALTDDPNTTAIFQWGTSSGSYPYSIPASPSPIGRSGATVVSAILTSLTPNTHYYFRLVTTTSSERFFGAEYTFFTGSHHIFVPITARFEN
jgi:hypothetical protein